MIILGKVGTRTTRTRRTNADFYFSSADDADNAVFLKLRYVYRKIKRNRRYPADEKLLAYRRAILLRVRPPCPCRPRTHLIHYRIKMNQSMFLCVIFISLLSCLVTFLTPSQMPSEWRYNESGTERHSVPDWIRFTQRVGGVAEGKEDIYEFFVTIITNWWNIQWIII